MSLRLNHITLRNFRSYEFFDLDNIGELTILHGPNAAGKTNVVEAIQLVTALQSFRTSENNDFVQRGTEKAQVEATFTDGNRELTTKLAIQDGKRTYTLNGKTASTHKLQGLVPAVIFSPEDLLLVKGAAHERRAELDNLGSQMHANYAQVSQDFRKILKQRNAVLKDEQPEQLLDALDDVYIEVSLKLADYRRALVKKIQPLITEAYRRITHEEAACLRYVPFLERGGADAEGGESQPVPAVAEGGESYPVHADTVNNKDERAQMRATLLQRRAEEYARKTSLVGPHKDELFFTISGEDAGKYASQGQQRSIVLAFKVAEVELLETMLGQKPLLLLDDVMSELDKERRGAVMQELLPRTQVFITTTHLDYFQEENIENARIISINNKN